MTRPTLRQSFEAARGRRGAVRRTAASPLGQVYLLEAGGRFKIGRASDVGRRLRQLNAGQSPFPIVLVHDVANRQPERLESWLHDAYAEFRVHGEWFEFDPVTVASVIGAMDYYRAGLFERVTG